MYTGEVVIQFKKINETLSKEKQGIYNYRFSLIAKCIRRITEKTQKDILRLKQKQKLRIIELGEEIDVNKIKVSNLSINPKESMQMQQNALYNNKLLI